MLWACGFLAYLIYERFKSYIWQENKVSTFQSQNKLLKAKSQKAREGGKEEILTLESRILRDRGRQ